VLCAATPNNKKGNGDKGEIERSCNFYFRQRHSFSSFLLLEILVFRANRGLPRLLFSPHIRLTGTRNQDEITVFTISWIPQPTSYQFMTIMLYQNETLLKEEGCVIFS
jgi:hypothetical protein